METNRSGEAGNAPALRMFVDENGNCNLREDLSNASNRFLCLTGVVMKLSAHDELERLLKNLKVRCFGTNEIILHRREIIPGKPPFEVLKDPEIRNQFNAEILRIVEELQYGVLSVVIDKKSLVDRYTLLKAQDPYALALEFLMQRYQYWIQDYNRKRGPATGDVLAESRGGREDRTTKETYRLIYEGNGYNKLESSAQYLSSKEIKLKKKKDNIAGLQFVDLISHPARRYILSQQRLLINTNPVSFEQRIVDILVAKKFRTHRGQIDGYGTVFFPK
jgi:hypothetical protein